MLDLAISEGLKLDVDCQLVNCVHADTASLAIEKLKQEKTFGIYANSSIYKKNKLEGFVSDSDEWHYHNHQPINHVEYREFVQEWINNGASVIGGCCRTTTEHIKEIKKLIDKYPSIGDWRNTGMLGCLELVKNRDTKESMASFNASPSEMSIINKVGSELRALGMFTYTRWNYTFVAPPLIANEEEIDEGMDIISKALLIADEYLSLIHI